MLRDDYLIRMVRNAATAIARALGAQPETDDEQTEFAIKEALGEVVRLPIATLLLLDHDSMMPLIAGGNAEAARVVARGLRGLADIDERGGRFADAKRKRAAGIAIYTRVGVGEDPADRETARSLTQRFAASSPRD